MIRPTVFPADELPKAMAELVERVDADGGHTLAAYREPVGNHWHAFVLLPIDKVAPTPYQRDLSPKQARRLQEVVKKISFEQAFSKLRANIEAFDVAKVRYEDVQRAGLVVAPAGD